MTVTGHVEVKSSDPVVLASMVAQLAQEDLPPNCFYMASFGRNTDGSFRLVADVSYPD